MIIFELQCIKYSVVYSYLSNVTAVAVGVIVDGLGATVGKGNAVGAGGGVTVTVLLHN